MWYAFQRGSDHIDIRGTSRIGADDAIADAARWRCVPGAFGPLAGRGLSLPNHPAEAGYDCANHCAVATPVPKTAHRWSAGDPSSRPETVGHHSDAPGESVGGDEAEAQRRVDPLVLSEIGQVPEGQ